MSHRKLLSRKGKKNVSGAKLRLLKNWNSIPTLFVNVTRLEQNSLTQSINVLKIFFVSFYSNQGDLKFKYLAATFFDYNRKSPASYSYIYTAKNVNEAQAWRLQFQVLPQCNELCVGWKITQSTYISLLNGIEKCLGGGTEMNAVPMSSPRTSNFCCR